MAQKIITLGTSPDGMDGDDARTAFGKTNDNFTELYQGIGSAQPANPKLSAIAGSVWLANQLLITTGADTLAMLATGVTGRALIAAADAAAGRTALGLGTAATGTLTTSTRDLNVGRVMRIGDGGMTGTSISLPITDLNTILEPGRFAFGNGVTNGPATGVAYYLDVQTHGSSLVFQRLQGMLAIHADKVYTRVLAGGSWTPWIQSLNAGTNGVGGQLIQLTTLAALNALNDSQQGFYFIAGAVATAAGIPKGYGGIILHYGRGNDVAVQHYTSTGTNDVQVYTRTYNTVSIGWSPWVKNMTSLDLVAGSYDATTGRIITTGQAGASYQAGWMGLGSNELPAAASLDSISNTSFYTFNDTAVGKPPLFNYGNVLTICRGASEATQIAFSVVSPITMTRYKLNSNWSAWADASGFGVGQNWGPNLQGSRSYDTAYTNNTNRVMMVQVFAGATVGAQVGLSITTGGVSVIGPYAPAAGAYISVGPVPVAPGATYVFSQRNGTAPINTWAEFK